MEDNVNNQEEVVDSKLSILTSIKKMLGISESCTDFDTDIIIHINTILMVLGQLGVGKEGFQIEDKTALWTEFIDKDKLSAAKSYTYLRVRLLFDPPLNSAILESMERTIQELAVRLNIEAESDDEEV